MTAKEVLERNLYLDMYKKTLEAGREQTKEGLAKALKMPLTRAWIERDIKYYDKQIKELVMLQQKAIEIIEGEEDKTIQTILLLRYLGGQDFKSIANTLDLKYSLVTSRHAKAMKRLGEKEVGEIAEVSA